MTFLQYWRRVKIDPALNNLDQRQLEALRKMMYRAYDAGHRHAMKEKTT